ncbi:MAG: hypothetical protein BroJett018_18180 [Chloroflexota bacterium]|nr:DUF1963 domain-containing protein [Chloroflexota bacterium]NOG63914.1 DUF1963 domain-containing protein [Chloroflexota bacterium]GIK64024.1 MAG: hypothetical protein BroJett018_18180 [Chloroflexota bacterium]
MREKLRELIHIGGLSHLSEQLESLMLDSIRAITQRVDNESEISIGASKLGGLPDLPSEIDWPIWNNIPLAFIAQINLAEVKAYDVDNVLPSAGMLYFFNDAEQPWGGSLEDRGRWKVIFYDGGAGLERKSAPTVLPSDGYFNPCSIEFSNEATLPPTDSNYKSTYKIGLLEITEQDYEALWALKPKLYGHGPNHSLLGHADVIQTPDMELACQLLSNGIQFGIGYKDPRFAELREGAKDWRLLFQVDTDDGANMMWGDVGRIYYWIRRQDLQARNFDKVWLILQCY